MVNRGRCDEIPLAAWGDPPEQVGGDYRLALSFLISAISSGTAFSHSATMP